MRENWIVGSGVARVKRKLVTLTRSVQDCNNRNRGALPNRAWGRGRDPASVAPPQSEGARRGPRVPHLQVPPAGRRLMAPRRERELLDAYAGHRVRGIKKIRSGDYAAALAEFEAASALAARTGSAATQQEARANLSMIYIQMGEDRKAEAGLREILLNSESSRTRFGAAYNL